jgi:hypothetical protein
MNVLTPATTLAIIFASLPLQAGRDASQLEDLMRERPNVAAIIATHKSLQEWLVKSFDGQFTGSRILWRDDDSALTDNSFGQHSYEKNGTVITVSHKPSAADQLTVLVYECVNARYEANYKALFDAAKKLQREEFVLKAMQIEHQATLDTQKVLRNNLNLKGEQVAATELYRKVMAEPTNFNESMDWYQKNKRPEFDARDYYRSVYDVLSSVGVLRPAETPTKK